MKKILLLGVEDDVYSQDITKYYLKEYFKICFAPSVKQAKEILEQHNVDMILMDLSLEGEENGLDLTHYLRESTKWCNIPIIAVTAHALPVDRENCLNAGCNEYLAKPFTKLALLEKINKWLEFK